MGAKLGGSGQGKQGRKWGKIHHLNRKKERLNEKRNNTTDSAKKEKIEEKLKKLDKKEKLNLIMFVLGDTNDQEIMDKRTAFAL